MHLDYTKLIKIIIKILQKKACILIFYYYIAFLKIALFIVLFFAKYRNEKKSHSTRD